MRLVGPCSGLGLAVATIVFVLDRLNKLWLVEFYDLPGRGRVEVTPFLDLVMVWNRGISYGLLQQDSDLGRQLLIVFSFAVAVVLMVWLARIRRGTLALGLGLIIGGALSNPVDRLIYGAVADFYRLHAFGWSWYVFNLADAAIVAGGAILLYESFDFGHKSARNRQ